MDLNKSVIYEIYPTSFYDSDGDGVGDLRGITEKLDYVKELGADIIWLNPIFKSAFLDGGYDVVDYREIDKKFGNFEDFSRLTEKAHRLGIKILIDLVIGHTSDKHNWFIQSKKAKKNKYSDYYVWTNSVFIGGENTIKGLAKRDGNYMVNYYSFQPALNYGFNLENRNNNNIWESDEWKVNYKDESLKPLREELLSIIYFWLDKGVDGFRVDLANSLIKGKYDREAYKWLWGYFIGNAKKKNPDVIFMSEWGNPSDSTYCGFDIDYVSHCSVGYNGLFRGEKGSNILPAFECGHSYFSADGLGSIDEFINYSLSVGEQLEKEKYYCVPSGYHDIVRIATNKSDDLMKCIFAFLLTYKNLPMIYYGDEIGMEHNYKVNKDGGYIRTGARTPMQWTNGKNRGFSEKDGRLYLPVSKKASASVESQAENENSLLNTVKNLVALKKNNDCFDFDAKIQMQSMAYPLVYTREKNGKKVLVAINPTNNVYVLDNKIGTVKMKVNAKTEGKITLLKQGFVIAEI